MARRLKRMGDAEQDSSVIGDPTVEENSLPLEWDEEADKGGDWFENFFECICVGELLPLVSEARKNGSHKCRFSGRTGGYNVILFLSFDDGVEWVAKLPKSPNIYKNWQRRRGGSIIEI